MRRKRRLRSPKLINRPTGHLVAVRWAITCAMWELPSDSPFYRRRRRDRRLRLDSPPAGCWAVAPLAALSFRMQQFLYFFPLPQGHGSLRPIALACATGRCLSLLAALAGRVAREGRRCGACWTSTW